MVFVDRQSKYPGRWTMVKEDGTSEVITLVRNDEPIVEGTPMNADTLNELSTVAGALNAKEAAMQSAAEALESKTSAANSAAAAASSASAAKESEQTSKEYLEQVKTISTGAQGWYTTPDALRSAVPVGEDGWWAVIGSTDTIWTWDSDTGAWVDTQKETDFSDFYSIQQVDEKLAKKSNVDHTHLYAGSDTAGGTANSVNGFTFSTTTTDPGAGGSLTTNTILLVYE